MMIVKQTTYEKLCEVMFYLYSICILSFTEIVEVGDGLKVVFFRTFYCVSKFKKLVGYNA